MQLLTIIIPAYNSSNTIEKCLQSILDGLAGVQDVEICVVDDGSTDNTREIIKKFIQGAPNLHLLEQQHQGTSAAKNYGIEKSTGKYICFVDGDDILDDDWCIKIRNAISASNSADYIIFSRTFHLSTPTRKKLPELICGINDRAHLSSPCSKLYKRAILDQASLRFFTGIQNGEDMLFNLQYNLYAKTVSFSPDGFYNYLHHSGSATTSFNLTFIQSDILFQRELKRVLEQYGHEYGYISTFSGANSWIGLFNRFSRSTKSYNYKLIQEYIENPTTRSFIRHYREVKQYFSKAQLMILWLLKHKLYKTTYYLFKIKHSPSYNMPSSERI